MPEKIVNKEINDSLERIDLSIGIYAITGFSLLVYIFWIDMPMLYRNIFIFLASCEGFIRTFFLEIRRLINKSKDIESKYLQNK